MIEKENVRKVAIGPYSAYAIAVKYGYTGTEEQWIKEVEADRVKAEAAAKSAEESKTAASESAVTASEKATAAETSANSAAASAEVAAKLAALDKTLSVSDSPADAKATGDAIAKKADKIVSHLFTIPIDGWQTDDTITGFTNYVDIAIDGMTDEDVVNVTVAPVSTSVAAKAQFTNTESLNGVLRLRAKNAPEAAISAQWYIVR